MGTEIERKFLMEVPKLPLLGGVTIHQGYIETASLTTVRVRTKDDGAVKEAFITVKGKTEGISRLEYEYKIPFSDAEEMLDKLCTHKLSKIRYEMEDRDNDLVWELDEFLGANEGLWLAEVELPNEVTEITRPYWVTREVSYDPHYFNVSLAKTPYQDWPEEERK